MPLPPPLGREGGEGERRAGDRGEHDPEGASVGRRELDRGDGETRACEAPAARDSGERPQLRAQRAGRAEPRELGDEQNTDGGGRAGAQNRARPSRGAVGVAEEEEAVEEEDGDAGAEAEQCKVERERERTLPADEPECDCRPEQLGEEELARRYEV